MRGRTHDETERGAGRKASGVLRCAASCSRCMQAGQLVLSRTMGGHRVAEERGGICLATPCGRDSDGSWSCNVIRTLTKTATE